MLSRRDADVTKPPVCKLFPAVTSVTMALDLEDSGKQRKTVKEQRTFLLFFCSWDRRCPRISAECRASMADNLWQNSKNSESALHYRHRDPSDPCRFA